MQWWTQLDIQLFRLFIENLLIKYHSIIFFFNKKDFWNKLNGWFNTNTIGIMKWIASFSVDGFIDRKYGRETFFIIVLRALMHFIIVQF